MNEQNPIQEAISKALLAGAIYSAALSPALIQPANAVELQPRCLQMVECLEVIAAVESPWFDQATVMSLLAARSKIEEKDRLKAEFQELAMSWKRDRRATSSSAAIAMHPSYQRIIGLGKPALPFILCELEREPDHWFWALACIANENPVPPHSRGKMQEMAAIWLAWGRSNGYLS